MNSTFPLLWVLKRIRRRVPALILLILSSAASAVLGVAFALGSRNVIDTAVAGNRDHFLTACLVQGCIILATLFCATLSRHLTERLKADLDRDWKQDLLHGLLQGDYASVSQYHSGELINRLNNDVRITDDGLVSALPHVVSMVVRLVCALLVMTVLEPWFTLVIFVAGVVVIIATTFLRRHLKAMHKRVSEKDGLVSSFLQECLEKLLLVQAMDVSQEMERRADDLLQQRYEMQRKRKNVSLFANTSVNIMSYGAGFLALVWCSANLLRGQMSFGSLTAVIQLVNQLQSPFTGLSAALPQYIAMNAAAERLMELENIPQEAEPSQLCAQSIYDRMNGICGENVVFSYDRDWVLRGASFCIPKGSFAAITGASGIGKSTMLKLLLGIFKPESGLLYADCGEERIPIDRSSRRLFAYVPQGNLLLSGTLRDNLVIAKPDASEDDIRQAVYVSAMDEYLHQLPKGLDTVLGESGAGLSEGQAQRLAIARAILGGAPILLLDECTSALDVATEKVVLKRIQALRDRTCIAVTHRPATMELCDLQLQIQDGQITVHPLR